MLRTIFPRSTRCTLVWRLGQLVRYIAFANVSLSKYLRSRDCHWFFLGITIVLLALDSLPIWLGSILASGIGPDHLFVDSFPISSWVSNQFQSQFSQVEIRNTGCGMRPSRPKTNFSSNTKNCIRYNCFHDSHIDALFCSIDNARTTGHGFLAQRVYTTLCWIFGVNPYVGNVVLRIAPSVIGNITIR